MLSGKEIFFSVIKCVIFVAIAAVLQCYYGYYASGGPEGSASLPAMRCARGHRGGGRREHAAHHGDVQPGFRRKVGG